MLRHLLIALLLVLSLPMWAQQRDPNASIIYLRVVDDQNHSVPFLSFYLTDAQTGRRTDSHTDHKGKAQVTARKNRAYNLHFKENVIYTTIKTNRNLFYTPKTVCYTPPRDYPRVPMTFPDTTILTGNESTEGAAQLLLHIVDQNNEGIPKLPVQIKDKEHVYLSQTDETGHAKMPMKLKVKYKLGISDFDDFLDVPVAKYPDLQLRMNLPYKTIDYQQTEQNDTITQILPKEPYATTDRVYLHIYLRDYDRMPLADEPVFLNALDQEKVYLATTNQDGIVEFLLPKNDRYRISFKYERDVDLLDYPLIPTEHTTKIEFSYIGSKNVEEFYQTNKRTPEGFLSSFMSSPVSSIPFKDQVVQTKNGYKINFEAKSPTASPAVANNLLFIGGGYYTEDFHCFDANSGEHQWSVELSDNGPTAAAYVDGLIITISESCTLYAIDALTGELRWSKWLGPDIYSTPAIDNEHVYAVYPNDSPLKSKQRFVLVAFDLQSGDIKWQQWLDGDVMASPVLTDQSLYLTTHQGALYKFNKADGQQLAYQKANALTPPTIVNNKLFTSTLDETGERALLAVFNADNLQLQKTFDQVSGTHLVKDVMELHASRTMLYNGSQVMHYKGYNYNIIDNQVFCTDLNGKLIWQKNSEMLGCEGSTLVAMPIAVRDVIIVSTNNGLMIALDPKHGKVKQTHHSNTVLFSQPVAEGGWLYSGSDDGSLTAIRTDNSYTGWPFWGQNPGRNPVIK